MLFRRLLLSRDASPRLVRDEDGSSPPRSNEGPVAITLAPPMFARDHPSRSPCTWVAHHLHLHEPRRVCSDCAETLR